jgi:Rrf2 family protein
MPERFLLQILRNLVTHGILRSTRGVDGGYALVRPPEELSLLDVIEAIEGPLASEELLVEGLPQDSRSRLNSALRRVTASARGQLEAVKFSHLLVPPTDQAPRGDCPSTEVILGKRPSSSLR